MTDGQFKRAVSLMSDFWPTVHVSSLRPLTVLCRLTDSNEVSPPITLTRDVEQVISFCQPILREGSFLFELIVLDHWHTKYTFSIRQGFEGSIIEIRFLDEVPTIVRGHEVCTRVYARLFSISDLQAPPSELLDLQELLV